MNNKILNQVVSNDDFYSWKNLTCTYRPWMTAFKSFGQLYEDAFLLLISYLAIYFDSEEEKRILDFIDCYNEYISDFMGITIKKHTFHNLYSMMAKVVESIDQEQPVLVPCDLIALPYNPMYKLEHRYKCMVLKGYDLNRNLYYILDNIHIDYGSSTILTDFVSDTLEMYNMNKEFAVILNYEQCIFYLEKNGDREIREYTILKRLSELIALYVRNEIKVVHWEKELRRIKMKENNHKFIEEIVKTLDFKFVFRDILHKLLIRISESDGKVDELCNEYGEICEKWTSIRNQVLYLQDEKMNHFDIDLHISKIERSEFMFMEKLKKFIDQLPDKSYTEISMIDQFRLLNNNNAKLIKTSSGYEVVHSKNKKYDTWQMQDNAFQLLIENVVEGDFETKLKFDTCFGEDIHSGIIIKMKSGIKFLYGNVRGQFIAIYCPELGKNFEIYSKVKYLDSENVDDWLKVSTTQNKINFYYMSDKEPIYSLPIEDEIKSIGIFSKTWEYLDHSVLFYDIKNDVTIK